MKWLNCGQDDGYPDDLLPGYDRDRCREILHEMGDEARASNKFLGGVMGAFAEPTSEHPAYRKSPQDRPSSEATQLWMIVCDEGWRESIVCKDLYEWAADWLVAQVQGKPYAPGKH